MQLIIKAPNQVTPDHSVEAQPDWTVSRLKEFLSESYPSHPAVEEQKLIHAGRLLHNHLLLKDVLRQEGPVHVLHLVCNSHSSNQMTSLSKASPSESSDVGAVPSSPVDVPSRGLHYRRNAPAASEQQLRVPMVGAASPEVVAQQMAAMQQYYAHYMAQFMQHAQAAGMGATYPFPDLSTLGMSAAPHEPSVQADEAPEVPQEPPRAERPAGRMNAQGGPLLDEEDEANRDWLDWFYVFSRAFVLFSIVYFYSSLGRFMVVVGITLLIYMYQAGWLTARRQEPVPQREQQPQEQPGEEESILQEPSPPVVVPAPSTLHSAWLLVKTFFSSLIPEQPPPININ